MNSTEKETKIKPIWTDTVNGVEVSIYRNVIKGRQFPVYKISRKKWYSDKEGLKSNYTLDRGDWAIARLLECDAWRHISRLAREERAEIKSSQDASSIEKGSAIDAIFEEKGKASD